MKRAIVTAAFGDRCGRMAEITLPTQRDYALRIGAAFITIESMPAGIVAKTVHWAKFKIDELFDDRLAFEGFDEIAWLDSDIAVSPNAPSIFDAAGGKFAAYPEGDVVDRIVAFREYYLRLRGKELDQKYSAYFNSGVMVIPRSARGIIKLPDQKEVDLTMRMREENPGRYFFDQNFINARIAESGLEVSRLTWRWNLMHVPGENSGVSWNDRAMRGWFIHYAGMMSAFGDAALDLVRADLEKWRINGSDKKESQG